MAAPKRYREVPNAEGVSDFADKGAAAAAAGGRARPLS